MSQEKRNREKSQVPIEVSQGLASLQTDYVRMREKCEKEYRNYQRLQTEAEEFRKEQKKLLEGIDVLKEKRESLQKKNTMMMDQIEKHRNEAKYQKKLLDDSKVQYAEYQNYLKEKDVVEKEVITLRAGYNSLVQMEREYNSRIGELSEKKKQLLTELKNLDENNHLENRKIDELRDSFHVKSQEYLRTIEKYKMEKANLESEIQAREEEIQRVRTESALVAEDEKKIRTEIEDLKFLRSKSEQEHQELQEKVEQDQAILKELEGVRADCDRQRSVLREIKDSVVEVEKQRIRIVDEISCVEEKREAANSDIELAKKELIVCQGRIRAKEDESVHMTSQFEELANQVNLEKGQLHQVLQDIKNQNVELDRKVQETRAVSGEIEKLNQKKTGIQVQISDLDLVVRDKKSELGKASADFREKESSLKKVKDLIVDRERDLSLMKDLEEEGKRRLDEMRTECLNYEKLISSEGTRIENIREKKHEMQKELDVLIGSVQNRNAELNAILKRFNESKIQLDALEDGKNSVHSEVVRLEETKERFQGHVREKQTILEEMRAKIKQVGTRLSTLQEDYKNEQIRYDVLSNKCETSNIEKRVLEDEKEKIKGDTGALKGEIEKYRNQLSESQAMCEREKARLENFKKSNTIKELEVKSVLDELEKNRDELIRVHGEIDEEKENVNQLRFKGKEYHGLIRDLEKQVETLQLQVANLDREKKTCQEEREGINNGIANLSNEERYCQDRVNRLRLRVEAFRKQSDTWNQRTLEKEAVYRKHEEEIKKIGELLMEEREKLGKMKDENLKYEEGRQTLMQRIDVATKHLRTLEEHRTGLVKRIDKYKKVMNHGVARKYISDVRDMYANSVSELSPEESGEDGPVEVEQLKKAS